MLNRLAQWLWYRDKYCYWLLWPLSQLYQVITKLRRWILIRQQQNFNVPVIVVGNITVGGTGKTPLVIALAKKLQAQGLKVGIVSRGYKASIKTFPYKVKRTDDPYLVGDEPLLIAQKTMAPVVIAPNRVSAVNYLLKHDNCQVIVSDDGLQHYRLGRAIEIAVIDGLNYFGNGLCLPAGPLRESLNRLKTVDFLVVNQGQYPNAYLMRLTPQPIKGLLSNTVFDEGKSIAAVAAIGKPERFYNTLSAMNLNFKAYPFPDHYIFKAQDLDLPEKNVLMTEKDAVKCQKFAKQHWYYLPIEATVEPDFWQALWAHLSLKKLLQP